MGAKEDALDALEKVIEQFNLKPSTVGREIAGDPSFLKRLRDPKKTISTNTLDNVWRFIIKMRGQMELDLDLEKD
jgi:hypothetical protein